MANGSRIEAPANRAGEVEGNNAQRKGKRIRSQVLSHAHTHTHKREGYRINMWGRDRLGGTGRIDSFPTDAIVSTVTGIFLFSAALF